MEAIQMLAETLIQQAAENGIIPVKLEDDVVRFRVGHLYANPASALRELYANELRACHTARDKYGANPRIQISVNVPERTIAIHGVDSLGITEENFLNVLSVLGENDNQDGSEVGQFGWGVQSYTSIANNILFETFARETGEKISMLGINGDHFSKVSQPTLRTTGTRLTLYVKDDLDIARLANQFHDICAYSDIPTFLNIINESALSPETPIDDACGVQVNNPDLGHGIWSGERIRVEDDDFQLAATLTSSNTYKPEIDVRLLRLPIKAPDLTLPFDHCVLSVKDERRYRPTADRERLTDEAVKRLQQKVDSKLREVLPKFLDIASFDDFRRKQCKSIYYSAYYATDASTTGTASIWRLYAPSETTKKLSKLLSLDVWVKDWSERRSPWATPKMVNKRSRLGEVVEELGNIFLVDSLDRGLQELLREQYSDAALMKPDDDWNDRDQVISELLEQGVRTDALSEAERIKNARGPVARSPPRTDPDEDSYEVILHGSRVREFKEHGITHRVLGDEPMTKALRSTRKGELAEGTVFVQNIEKYLPILAEVPTNRYLARLDRLPKRFRDSRMTLDRFIEIAAEGEVATSKGKCTLKSLLQESNVTILVYEDKRIAYVYNGECLLVPLSADEAFELCLFLRAHDASYRVWLVPPEGEFMRTTGKYLSDYGFNESTFSTEDNQRVNVVYHVSLAVKDERMRRLFLAAATKTELINRLSALRDFTLKNFANRSPG
jgi:hypothetical protein